MPISHYKGLVRSDSTLNMFSFPACPTNYFLGCDTYHPLMGMLNFFWTFATSCSLFSNQVIPLNYSFILKEQVFHPNVCAIYSNHTKENDGDAKLSKIRAGIVVHTISTGFECTKVATLLLSNSVKFVRTEKSNQPTTITILIITNKRCKLNK